MPRKPPRPVGDFFGPFFSLEFKAPLSLPAAPTSTNPNDIAVFASEANQIVADNHFVTAKLDSIQLRNYAGRMTVEAEGASPLKFTLTLTPPYDAALEILDNRIIRVGTIVTGQWGYLSNGRDSDIVSDTFIFTINEPPKATFGKEITITITGYDPVSSALMGKERKKIYTREEFVSDRALLDAILVELKYQGEFQASPETIERLALPKTDPIEEQRDIWTLLSSVCLNNNVTFYISSETTIIFHDLSHLATIPEAYRLLWYTQPQNDRDIPMISFSAEALPAFFLPASKALLNVSYDPDTGKIVRETLDPGSLRDLIRTDSKAQIPGGTENTSTGKSVKIGNITFTPSPPYVPNQDFGSILSQPNMMDNKGGRAKRLLLEAIFAANNKAVVSAPGHPDVFPPMNVIVEGVGKSFSGTYQIKKAKHEVSTNGYEMNLELMRLASPPDLMDGQPVTSPVKPTSPVTSGSTPSPKSPDQT